MSEVRLVPTPHGDARLIRDRSRHPMATMLLGHGAGGGADARDLVALATELISEVTIKIARNPDKAQQLA